MDRVTYAGCTLAHWCITPERDGGLEALIERLARHAVGHVREGGLYAALATERVHVYAVHWPSDSPDGEITITPQGCTADGVARVEPLDHDAATQLLRARVSAIIGAQDAADAMGCCWECLRVYEDCDCEAD